MTVMERCIFFHIPKAGGTWVRNALKYSTNVLVEINKHPVPKDCLYIGNFTFCHVRHPLSWYRSYFDYKQRVGWRFDKGLDTLKSDTFDEFIERVIKEAPGHLTKMYERRQVGSMVFVGKFENLREDTVKALELAGQPFDKNKLLDFPPMNVSKAHSKWDTGLAKEILKHERVLLQKYGYGENPKEAI